MKNKENDREEIRQAIIAGASGYKIAKRIIEWAEREMPDPEQTDGRERAAVTQIMAVLKLSLSDARALHSELVVVY